MGSRVSRIRRRKTSRLCRDVRLCGVEPRLVRIPRHLLHIEFDDLARLGIPDNKRAALRGLLADLPLLPRAEHSAQLIGAPDVTLPCLAVLARHVGQGLRDHNLSLAHDRHALRTQRQKLLFLDAAALHAVIESGDQRPAHEAVLFVVNATPGLVPLLESRAARDLASFVTEEARLNDLAHWRAV